ncbi:MAG TPA: EamA family transporter, partial [Lysinibacillus sp.]|nr:EamA family transporter [Lysinibacillus sp.]
QLSGVSWLGVAMLLGSIVVLTIGGRQGRLHNKLKP